MGNMNISEAIDKMIEGYNFVNYGVMSFSNDIMQLAKSLPFLNESIERIKKLHFYEIRGIFDKATGILTITADAYDPSQEYGFRRLMCETMPIEKFVTDEGKEAVGEIFANMTDTIAEFIIKELNDHAQKNLLNENYKLPLPISPFRSKEDVFRILDERIYIEDIDKEFVSSIIKPDAKQSEKEESHLNSDKTYSFNSALPELMDDKDRENINTIGEEIFSFMKNRILMNGFKGFGVIIEAEVNIGLENTKSIAVAIAESSIVCNLLMINYTGYFQSDISSKVKTAIIEPSAISVSSSYDESFNRVTEIILFETIAFIRKISSEPFTLRVKTYNKNMRGGKLNYV